MTQQMKTFANYFECYAISSTYTYVYKHMTLGCEHISYGLVHIYQYLMLIRPKGVIIKSIIVTK